MKGNGDEDGKCANWIGFSFNVTNNLFFSNFYGFWNCVCYIYQVYDYHSGLVDAGVESEAV